MERSEEDRKTDVLEARMGRIMLRFRPIAPKPVGPAGGGSSSSSSTGPPVVEYDSSSSSSGRRRRGNNNKGGSRERKKRVSTTTSNINININDVSVSRPLTLLSLMPPQLNHKTSQLIDPIPSSSNTHVGNIVGSTRRTTTSNVVVESVVGFVDDGNDPWHCLSWCKEEEAMRWLENEISPAFLSNGFVSVRWTNTAYRRMVEKEKEMETELVMAMPMVVEISKSPLLSEQVIITGNAFTCRVKVINYNSQRERGSFASLCDMWRLLDGLFAWRIDVDAALSLGRLMES